MYNQELLDLLQKVLGFYKLDRKNNAAFSCPFCNTPKQKLTIQLQTNKELQNPWHCWVCGVSGRTITKLFTKLKRSKDDIKQVISIIGQPPRKLVGSNELSNLFVETTKSDSIIQLPPEIKYFHDPSSKSDINFGDALSYLISRKLTIYDIIRYNIGFCSSGRYAGRIIIPSYNSHGQLNYFISRAYTDDSRKYINSENNKDSIIMFENTLDWSQPINIVEGPFDAIAVKRNATCLLGNTISSALLTKIIQTKCEVNICLDTDAEKRALELISELNSHGIKVNKIPLTTKDPGELGFIEFTLNTLPNKYQINSSDLFKQQLYGML